MLQKTKIKEIYDPYLNNSKESKERKKVCIVMPTYNQYEATRKNIILLKKQTLVPDVIVVDNNSSDNTFEKLKEEFPDIILIKLNNNYGGAGGFYIGQKYAYEKNYEYIILNDNDAYPIENDLIETLVNECDETTITQPFNVAEDLEDNNSFWFFHYVCIHKKILKKLGCVDYKLFLYGDEVEYLLRLEKFKYKLKKITKKYYHPLKYHYKPNRVYFAVRNEIYLQNIYKKRKKSFFFNLVVKLSYYYIYEKNKYLISKRAICDLINKNWDNSFIFKTISSGLTYKELKKEDFLKILKNKKVIFTKIPKLEKLLKDYSNKKEYKKFIYPRNSILLTHSPVASMFLFNKIIYLVDYDEKKEKVIFFELENNLFRKLSYFMSFLYFSIYLFVILFLTRNNCEYFKKINECDLRCQNQNSSS